jgi:predicted  nucleic acid-binding Zn-ribbon protein
MLTKNDKKYISDSIKKELKKYPTRNETEIMLQKVVDDLIDFLNPSLKKIDDIHTEVKGHTDDIDNHERRISKLEEKVFATTA